MNHHLKKIIGYWIAALSSLQQPQGAPKNFHGGWEQWKALLKPQK